MSQDQQKSGFVKQISWYLDALLRLGKTYRQVKSNTGRIEALTASNAILHTHMEHVLSVRDDTENLKRASANAERSIVSLENRLYHLAAAFDAEYLMLETDLRKLSAPEGGQHLADARAARAASDLSECESSDEVGRILAEVLAQTDPHRSSRREERLRTLDRHANEILLAIERTGGAPVLDLGGGTAIWVEWLTARGFVSTGVEPDPVMACECAARGLPVKAAESAKPFPEGESSRFGAVTKHLLAEVGSIEDDVRLLLATYRALAPGGLVWVEVAGGNPTRRREQLLAIADVIGYEQISGRPLTALQDEVDRSGSWYLTAVKPAISGVGSDPSQQAAS